MLNLRYILLILSPKAIVISATAVISTYLCIKYDLTANYPLTLIATAVVFPIVFSISGAYKRREVALDKYGTLKSHAHCLYFAVRDWTEKPEEASLNKARELIGDLFESYRNLLSQPVSKLRENENAVYKSFSDLSIFIKEHLREKGVATGEVSRANQYLSKMFDAFEDTKHIYQYRTPTSLRSFSDFFITVLPALYGPYFAYVASDYSSVLTYVMPILFSLILVSLDNIQDHLENPFDQIGEDDVTINVEHIVKRLY